MPLVLHNLRRPNLCWRRLIWGLVFAFGADSANASVVSGAAPEAAGEYQLKAAFLYNFAKFIDWPSKAFPSANTPFTFCVLGADPFGADLERTINNETLGGRQTVIRRLKRQQDAETCHILFISGSEKESVGQILGTLKNTTILTVSEFDSFTQHGGMINLYMKENRIRFEINVAPAEHVGLRISSKLLKLAKPSQ